MGDEIGLAADVNVALVGTAAQPLVERSAVALLLAAVQLTSKDVVSPEDFVFAVSAKPVLGEDSSILLQAALLSPCCITH